MAEIRNLLIAY